MLLEECYNIRLRINELDEDIEDLESKLYSTKNQIISDMPRGGGAGNDKTDRLISKKWRKEKQRDDLLKQLKGKWIKATEQLFSIRATEPQIILMYKRYYQGLKWKICEKFMQKKYGHEWNENKVYSTNRYILDKLHEIELSEPTIFGKNDN